MAAEAPSFRGASLLLPLEPLGDVSPSQRATVLARGSQEGLEGRSTRGTPSCRVSPHPSNCGSQRGLRLSLHAPLTHPDLSELLRALDDPPGVAPKWEKHTNQ